MCHLTYITKDMCTEMKLEVCGINVNSTWFLRAKIMDEFYFCIFLLIIIEVIDEYIFIMKIKI